MPAAVDLLQAYNASTVSVDFLAHFFNRALAVDIGSGAGRVQGGSVDVLEIDCQQAVFRAAVDGEEVHAVVVHAHGVGLVGRGVAAVGLPRVAVAVQWRPQGAST